MQFTLVTIVASTLWINIISQSVIYTEPTSQSSVQPNSTHSSSFQVTPSRTYDLIKFWQGNADYSLPNNPLAAEVDRLEGLGGQQNQESWGRLSGPLEQESEHQGWKKIEARLSTKPVGPDSFMALCYGQIVGEL